MGFGPTFLPPTIGARDIAKKLGLGARKVGQAIGSGVQSAAEVGNAFLEGASGNEDTGVTRNPQNAATAVAPQPAAKVTTRPGVANATGKQGGETSLAQKYGRGVTSSIRAGAYQDSPGFGQFGSSGPRSLAQMVTDDNASRLLAETYGARQAENEALAPRPQEDSLRAKVLNAQYEELMPAEGPSPLFGSNGAFKMNGNTITNSGPGLNLKQALQQRDLQLKNAEGMLAQGRGNLAADLQDYRSKLDGAVSSGRPINGRVLSKADADAMYAEAVRRTQELAGIMKSGFPPGDLGIR